MALLEGRGLTKKFGGVVAIDDVSFGVERGEAVGLIGPNGAGKSTLFRTITGVHPPTEGKVFFDGEDITGESQHEICHRGLAKTHQIVRPFGSLSLLENVAVGASFGGREFDDPRERAAEMIEFVGLEEQMHADTDELSVGQLKRLEIARVLATDPEMVLFDEVAGGLDPEETEGIIDLVGDIIDEGKTVFLIDHEVAPALWATGLFLLCFLLIVFLLAAVRSYCGIAHDVVWDGGAHGDLSGIDLSPKNPGGSVTPNS
jgi:branched-chain amino acid transport system ATP-binding protein